MPKRSAIITIGPCLSFGSGPCRLSLSRVLLRMLNSAKQMSDARVSLAAEGACWVPRLRLPAQRADGLCTRMAGTRTLVGCWRQHAGTLVPPLQAAPAYRGNGKAHQSPPDRPPDALLPPSSCLHSGRHPGDFFCRQIACESRMHANPPKVLRDSIFLLSFMLCWAEATIQGHISAFWFVAQWFRPTIRCLPALIRPVVE